MKRKTLFIVIGAAAAVFIAGFTIYSVFFQRSARIYDARKAIAALSGLPIDEQTVEVSNYDHNVIRINYPGWTYGYDIKYDLLDFIMDRRLPESARDGAPTISEADAAEIAKGYLELYSPNLKDPVLSECKYLDNSNYFAITFVHRVAPDSISGTKAVVWIGGRGEFRYISNIYENLPYR